MGLQQLRLSVEHQFHDSGGSCPSKVEVTDLELIVLGPIMEIPAPVVFGETGVAPSAGAVARDWCGCRGATDEDLFPMSVISAVIISPSRRVGLSPNS